MTTVKISKTLADAATALFNDGKTPWVVLDDGAVEFVCGGRAAAREYSKTHEFKGHHTICKASEVEFQVAGMVFDMSNSKVIEPTADKLADEFDAKLAEVKAQSQGDALADKQLADAVTAGAVDAPAKTKIPHTRESTIERPCKQVWHIADAMAKAAGGHDKLKRKEVLARCVASGIAFYTARTQYQLWLTIQNGGSI